ncbi:MAG: ATP-binding protein, partial [Bacteroidales bacterium]|nr:ATP-binding protein [Bacteroidales bacterium]
MKEELLYFKPRARILLQLGEQLIKNESIALLEIVKNSYDADAQNVKVTFQNIDDQKKGKIIIQDDGTGMDADIIRNVWMEPGSDYKAKLFKEKIRSPKFNRLPLGEKGIGRFGVHKLGSKIELISKQHNNNEVYFHIDWTKFERANYLDDVGIELFERQAKVFQNQKTGTKIIIKKLKTTWTRGMLRDVYRALNSLNSPFESLDSFKISFKTDKQEWLKGLLSFDDIKDYALFKAEAQINANVISKLKYDFSPWKTMTKLNTRKIIKENIKLIKYDKGIRKWVPFNYYNSRVGNIKLKLLIFDRGSKILSYGVQDKKGLTDYLDINGGIRVYRDGVRVYDYGEPENDWLELDIRRVNIPTVRISNNIVVGAVYLQREQSEHLIEKTNREGFIENQSYEYFK